MSRIGKSCRLPAVAATLLLMLTGCGRYGQLRLDRAAEDPGALAEIVAARESFDIYWIGQRKATVSAVIFDPRDDGITLTGKGWKPVEDSETLSDLVEQIRSQQNSAPNAYYPRLWRIQGPDGKFSGYLLTSWDFANIQRGADTLTVIIPRQPPFLADDHP
jgi:hypothetical protein